MSHLALFACCLLIIGSCCADFFTDQWAVRVEGGEEVARQLANKHGYIFVATVGFLPIYKTIMIII